MRKHFLIPAGVVAVAVLAAAAWWFVGKHAPAPQQAVGDRGEVLYWYDPMKPEVRFDHSGPSPFMPSMQLQPKLAPDSDRGYAGASASAVIEVDPRMVQNLGVRTARVERGAFDLRLEAVGAVEVDPRRLYVVESRAAGWVEQLHVHAVGDPVARGQRVAGVYSPELFAAQEELVLAAHSGDKDLLAASRQRAALLGISEAQIREVLASGHAQRDAWVVAPSDGVATGIHVHEGAQVAPGAPLMRIADLSSVWITVEIPEAEGAQVRAGQSAQARLPALPDRSFAGTVDYVYPILDAPTRTVRVRLVFDNPDGALKPGMYADVRLSGATRGDVLRVPSEAVIRTGTRDTVIVSEGQGRFRPAEVVLGPERDGETVILSGLEEGQKVVTSGQFLIDSEASLQGAYQRLSGPGRGAPRP